MKYKRIPTQVDAVQWTGENYDDVKGLSDGLCKLLPTGGEVLVPRPDENDHVAFKGDWIIKQGNLFCVCHDLVFHKMYEPSR